MMVRTLIVSMSVFALGHIAQAQPSTGDNANSTSADATPTNELLLSAYKREFAFLEAERDALKKRLAAIDERMKLKIRRARSAVELGTSARSWEHRGSLPTSLAAGWKPLAESSTL